VDEKKEFSEQCPICLHTYNQKLQFELDRQNHEENLPDLVRIAQGPNPTTSEFTATTTALSKARAFLKGDENIFCFENALGYSWRCKFLQKITTFF
jgi:hypothetical protein